MEIGRHSGAALRAAQPLPRRRAFFSAVMMATHLRQRATGLLRVIAQHLPPRREVAKAIGVAVAYYAGAEVAFWVGTLSYFFAPLWPPNVILFCALLQAPFRSWWVYIAAAFPAHAAAELQVGMAAPELLGAFACNVSFAICAAAGLHRLAQGPPWLDTLAKAWTFIVVSVVAAPGVVALGVAILASVTHDTAGSAEFAVRWGLANVLGGIALAPILVTWVGEGLGWVKQLTIRRTSEAIALAALLIGSAYVGFPAAAAEYPVLACTPIPLMLWAAVRFGPRGAAGAIFVVTLMALAGAIAGRAPFATASPEHTILSLQTFLAVLSAPFLVLAAVVAERRRATIDTAQARDELQAILDNTPAIVCVRDLQGRPLLVNRSARLSFAGLGAGALGRRSSYDFPPEIAAAWTDEDTKIIAGGQPITNEERVELEDGVHLYVKNKFALRNRDEVIYAVCAVLTDITDLDRAKHEVQDLSAHLLSAQDEERRRIARELHDSTGQSITAALINLHQLGDDRALDAGTRLSLQEAARLIDQVHAEIRTLSYLLHPPLLDEVGLAPALRWYVDGFAKRSGIDVQLRVAPDIGRLEPDAELALFRVVQESLTNVYRHSGSATAEIQLSRSTDHVVLTISDAGHGIGGKVGAAKRDGALGVGIAGMRARLKQLGGRLDIHSRVDGMCVSAILPRMRAGTGHSPPA